MFLMQKLLRSSFAQTLHTLVAIAVGLFMLPFMVSQLGESQYGIWVLIGGFTATLYLFDFGFASAVTRFMARYIQQGDDEQANEVINSALIIYSGLAVLILLASMGVAWISPIWVEDPQNEVLVRILIMIVGFQIAFGFPFKAFAGISAAYVRYDLTAWCRIIVKLISTGCVVAALLYGYELIAVALLQMAGAITTDFLFLAIACHLHSALRFNRRYINKQRMKELFNYSNWAFLIDITKLIKEKADIFLVGAYLGTSTLTIYYVAIRLVEYSLQFLMKATGMTTPVFAQCQAKGDMEDLKNKLAFFLRINVLLGGFAAYSLILLGEPLIELWMGSDFSYPTAYHVLVILISGRILTFMFAPMGSVLMAISRHSRQAILGIFETIVSVGLVYLLIGWFDYGLTGAAAGIASPFLLTRTIIQPLIIGQEIEFSIFRFYHAVGGPFLTLGVAFVVSYSILNELFVVDSLATLFVSGIIISVVYWTLALLALRRQEWEYASRLLPGPISRMIRVRLGLN